MNNKPGGPEGKKNLYQNVAAASAVAVMNAVMAWAFAFGIGMSSRPNNENPFFFLGVRDDYLPFVFFCSVPATAMILFLLWKSGMRGLALAASLAYFLAISWFLFAAFAEP